MANTLALVVLAPFAAALLAPMFERLVRPLAALLLAIVPALIFAFLATQIEQIATGGAVAQQMGWVPALGLTLDFRLDGLGLVFALAISGVGAAIVWFSGSYMKGHPERGRFLALILLFMGAMLGVVLADNFLTLFLFWELTSITSFLLIGFDRERQAARRAAIQALVITGSGGLALLVAGVLIWTLTGDWSLSAFVSGGRALDGGLYLAVLALVLLAAFTKSAQWPFHFWLPNAMEAPTPVSAFLHSATMVQAGVYLLARLSPALGGTAAWSWALCLIGGITLLLGSIAAFRQTDLKQMLAQSTLGSLGLLVLLLGLNSAYAVLGAGLYFLAHALYKAALFMAVGAVDHETGTRELTALGGLADRMPVTFIAAALACLSMIGLPPTLGFFGKEEMYLIAGLDIVPLLATLVLFLGNALIAGLAMLLLVRPFLGPVMPTPKAAHEAPIPMLAGPLMLGAAGVVLALNPGWVGDTLLVPMSSAILGRPVEVHLGWTIDLQSPAPWLSLLTWALGYWLYRQAAVIRTLLRRFARAMGWTADTAFDAAMFALIRFSGVLTRLIQHGRLEIYLVTAIAALGAALLVPMLLPAGLAQVFGAADLGAAPAWPSLPVHEWGIVVLALVGLSGVLLATSRLVAIVALGIQGASVALVFLAYGAPDLAFTQFMVEILSVVILALVMTRLHLDERDNRPLEDWLRDGAIALGCGLGVTLLLLAILNGPLDLRLSEAYAAASTPLAHGRNIVNVILVDFRGFDTLGEIAVVMGAGLAIAALLRRRKSGESRP